MSATTQLERILDHGERSVCRLLNNWNRPRIRALVKALSEGGQLHEEHSHDLIVSTDLLVATGDPLDQWGSLVYEQRGGLSNTAYRQIILAKLLALSCDGTIEALLELLATAAGPDAVARHQANYPASFYLWVIRPTFMDPLQLRRVARLMELARPATRDMILIEAVVGYFGYTPDIEAEGYDIGPYSRLIQ